MFKKTDPKKGFAEGMRESDTRGESPAEERDESPAYEAAEQRGMARSKRNKPSRAPKPRGMY